LLRRPLRLCGRSIETPSLPRTPIRWIAFMTQRLRYFVDGQDEDPPSSNLQEQDELAKTDLQTMPSQGECFYR
jgi:hypothetical protein